MYAQIDVAPSARSTSTRGATAAPSHNPAVALAQIIAALKGPDGRIRIPGFYDDVVALTDAEREAIAALPFDEEAFRVETGVPALVGESGYTTLERKSVRPTLDVNGIWGGFQGEGSKTIIPAHGPRQGQHAARRRPGPERHLREARGVRRGDRPAGCRCQRHPAGDGSADQSRPIDHPVTSVRRRVPWRRCSGGRLSSSVRGWVDPDRAPASSRSSACRSCSRASPSRTTAPTRQTNGSTSATTRRRHPDHRRRRSTRSPRSDVDRSGPAQYGWVIRSQARCYPRFRRMSAKSAALRGGSDRVSTDLETEANVAPAPAARGWRLDTDNGSMAPRSALDVLVDLNERVTTGNLAEYQPVPLGFTPLDKTIGTGLRAGELLLIGGAQGTGKTTMALQMARNIASGGQANVLYLCFEHDEAYLMNRLIAMESALAHLPAQDRRDQDPGRPQGDPRHLDGRGCREPAARQQPAPPAVARPHRALRPEPVPAARLADRQHHRQHPQARPAAPRAVGRSAARRLRRLHAEGAAGPRARERVREGHVHRQRPQGHRPVRGRADGRRSSPPTRKASRRRACATSTCAARRRSTTRPTSS